MIKQSTIRALGIGIFAMALGSVTGCQTHIAGMTLPSGHYMEHPPQYFAPSPFFPLSKELASIEAGGNNAQGGVNGGAAAPLPAPLPGPNGLPN
ncbi:MAG: hypothetical protein EXR99_03350 [Gemmataceae bacterium]|nr:hypothetical protein [Gemmataceae bacterium]